MKIYHYTSIENLVLILKNKTIRLNRLDRMDDPCECNFYSLGLNWSPYTYVSCWTEFDEENIPLWHMYAKSGVGVRIRMDKDCINWGKCLRAGRRPIDLGKRPPEHIGHFSTAMRLQPFTIFGNMGPECYHSINYINNPYCTEEVSIGANSTIVGKKLTINDFHKYIGLYKDIKWAFQKETRFRLFMIPQIINCESMDYDEFEKIIKENTYNPFNYIDLYLKESAFDDIEITLGPSATESNFLIVKAITEKYSPSAKIRGSILNSKTWRFSNSDE